jgi:hypothetical protein
VKKFNHASLRRRKQRIQERLRHEAGADRPVPMFRGPRPVYTVSDRATATAVGGIGAIHTMVRELGLDRAIDEALHLLKRHLPYHESDHVLNIAYNLMAGGTKLEDLEVLRQDEGYMDLLGAERIPDPTTAGDFVRRLGARDVERLMDLTNETRVQVWRDQPEDFRRCALIDVDGTLAPTVGQKKRGMGISYKGIWGYAPLLVTLANTREPLFVVNRPGNRPSHDGAAKWIDKALDLCQPEFERVVLRGDTDFSLTTELDRWDERGVHFVFGYDAAPKLVEFAANLPQKAWEPLERRRDRSRERRTKRENVKEQIVVENGYVNIKLKAEWVAQFPYRPGKCKRAYRMVVVRKNLSVERGDQVLFDDLRYFFYITNDGDLTAREIVALANGRCDQENVIEQLKNGVNALRVPAYDLQSNWAYMVIASLAWTLKAWFGMRLPEPEAKADVLRMEFKRFYHAVIRIPCQVVRTARGLELRLLAWTDRAHYLLQSMQVTARLSSA